MDLFEHLIDSNNNLLPYDGIVNDYGRVFDADAADSHFQSLLNTVDWQHDSAVIYGKTITTKRAVSYYGDHPFSYTYSGVTRTAKPWLPLLLDLKDHIERITNETYNACLLNLYHNGEEGMSWHSDGEVDLVKHGAIAALSLGAERKFSFKHKRTKEKLDLWLAHGSLIVMRGCTQSHWLHCVPPTKKVRTPRISLTFRHMRKPTGY